MLVALAVAAGLAILFGHIAEEVLEGDSSAFDRTVLLALRNPADLADPLGPPWLEEAARDITALGSYSVLGLLIGAGCGLPAHGPEEASRLLAACLGPWRRGAQHNPQNRLRSAPARYCRAYGTCLHGELSKWPRSPLCRRLFDARHPFGNHEVLSGREALFSKSGALPEHHGWRDAHLPGSSLSDRRPGRLVLWRRVGNSLLDGLVLDRKTLRGQA